MLDEKDSDDKPAFRKRRKMPYESAAIFGVITSEKSFCRKIFLASIGYILVLAVAVLSY